MISDEMAKILSYGTMFAIFALSIMTRTRVSPQKQFAKPTKYLLLFIAISCFMPMFANVDQTISQTVVATIPYFSYGLYLAFRKFDIDRNFIYGLVFTIATFAIITHIINHITFPVITFGIPRDEYEIDRGGLRLAIIGFSYVVLAFFIAVGEWCRTHKIWWWIPIIIFFVAIISSYTRQHIMVCAIVGMWMLLGNIGLIKKIILISAGALLLAYTVPKIPIFNKMMDLTVEQYEENEYTTKENVRITAARYYGYEEFETTSNHIFGNGVPSFRSNWGAAFETHAKMEHLHTHDVGWFGMNWYFGICAVLCMFYICFVAVFRKSKHSTAFIKYFFIWFFVTGFTSGTPLYQHQIIVTVLAMALMDCGRVQIEHRKRRVETTQWGEQFSWRRIKSQPLNK